MTERTVTLIGTEGTRLELACPGGPFFLGRNAGLWGSSPRSINSGPLGGMPGEVVSSASYAPRDLIVPILINEDTNSELDNMIEQLSTITRNKDIDCEIRVDTAGTRNTSRSIFARYISGLETLTVDHFGVDVVRPRLRFRAHDPFWIDSNQPSGGFGLTQFNNAFGAGINHIGINFDETAEVWPTWTFTGITENITALNLRTGKAWRFTEKLERIGDVLEIRTDPRGETGAFLNGGPRIWEFDASSELWGFLPGRNFFEVSGLNAAGDSSIGKFAFNVLKRFENC